MSARMERQGWLGAVMAVALLAPFACGGETGSPRAGSETHFLMSCDGVCPDNFQCLCGVCTKPCSGTDSCVSSAEDAVCTAVQPRVAQGRCEADGPQNFCDVSCLVDADCASLSAAQHCAAGFCRDESAASLVVSSPSGACEPSGVAASDLLVLGDSLIELTTFTTALEADAVAAGVLQDGEHFRQAASPTSSFLADNALSIASQYTEEVANRGVPRVVVMDGGETDMFQGLCDSEPQYECPTVQAAVSGAQSLLDQMVSDGVEHVVYFFYPDPRDLPALKASLDVLRPLLENACGMSSLSCHWVDLRTDFADHSEYLADDGMLFSDAGAQVAASAVWLRMEARCIAQ